MVEDPRLPRSGERPGDDHHGLDGDADDDAGDDISDIHNKVEISLKWRDTWSPSFAIAAIGGELMNGFPITEEQKLCCADW